MKKIFIYLFFGLFSAFSLHAQEHDGFHIAGSDLHDANGNNFVMKGINVPLAWFTNQTLTNIGNIADVSGANTFRIVVGNCYAPQDGTGDDWCTAENDWKQAVELCIENDVIPMIEVHNVLGSNDPDDLQAVADWWASHADYLTSPEIAPYILINISNEWGNWQMANPNQEPSQTVWRDAYNAAISTIRDAGITTTLIVDAPNYGQDYQTSTILNQAPAVLENDPEGNIMFSVHMYCQWSVNGESSISTDLPAIKNAGIPINVGEFGPEHEQGDGFCDIDEDLILSTADEHGIGWQAWSWTGNGACCESLDMSNDWAGTDLTTWGDRIINGENGTQTSYAASVFTGEAPNQQPAITLTAPEDGAVYSAGDDVTIEANASDSDGEVVLVEFFNGNEPIFTTENAPYGYTWTDLPAGTHTLTARATDDDDVTTTSEEVTITVCELIDVEGEELCEAGTATLSVLEAEGEYTLYETEENGEPLMTTEDGMFEVEVSETSTFYIAEGGSGSEIFSLGKTEQDAEAEVWNLSGDDFDPDTEAGQDKNIAITVEEEAIIAAVHVYSGANNNEVNLRIMQGTTEVGSGSATVDAGKQRIPMGVTLEPGEYTMDAFGTTDVLEYQAEGGELPYTIDGVISFTGTQSWFIEENRYGFFYDWEIEMGSPQSECPRTPVTAVVDGEAEGCTTVSTDHTINQTVKCYPNPSRDNFTIEAEGTFQYTINDINGNQVEKGNANGNFTTKEDLSPGVYLLNIRTNDASKMIKLIKK